MFYSIVIDTTDFLDRQKKRSATEILQKHFFFHCKKQSKTKAKSNKQVQKKCKERKGSKIFGHFSTL